MERAQISPDLNVGHATHAGMTGKHNEDFFGVFAWKMDDGRRFDLGVVADGVGGQTAGEVASHLAVEEIQKYFDQQSEVNAGGVNSHLERAILAANQAVFRASQDNPAHQGMSTTIALVAMLDDRLYTAHVGDSRIYLFREGRLQQISVDHTWAQEAIDAGLLTRDQARTHPNRNVIRRHVGGSSRVEVDHRLILRPGESDGQAEANQGLSLQAGDTILVCSDGLTDMISDSSVYASLHDHFTDLPRASQELVNKANQAGGKDNITVVLMQVSPNGAAVILPPPVSATATAATTAAASSSSAAATAAAASTAAPATAATTAAASTTAVAATKATAGGGTAATTGLGRVTWLIIGGAVLLLLLMLAVGALIVFGSTLRGSSTPESTAGPALNIDPDSTLPAGAPATAAILATALATSGSQDGSGLLETPGLIPTLRSTITATPRRGATPGATPTFTVKATVAPTSSSGGSSSSSGGGSKAKPTQTNSPPDTPVPPPDTPVPPPDTPEPPPDTPEPPPDTPEPPPDTPEPPPDTPEPPSEPEPPDPPDD